jgi:hypothetical protein
VTDAAQILQRLDELEKRVATAEREREEYRALYLQTMERCRKLELGILGSKSEHLPENTAQLSLGVLSMVLGERKSRGARCRARRRQRRAAGRSAHAPQGRTKAAAGVHAAR